MIAATLQMPTDQLMVNPVVWSSLATPIHPVKGTDGCIHLIYGLNVTNALHNDIRLTSIEVLDEQEKPITGTTFNAARIDRTLQHVAILGLRSQKWYKLFVLVVGLWL